MRFLPFVSYLLLTISVTFFYRDVAQQNGQKHHLLPSSSKISNDLNNVRLKHVLGINAFEWDFEEPYNPTVINESKLQAVKNFAAVRHYMDWEKLEASEGSYTFNPTHSGGWNYDAIYERCRAEGIDVLACLKTIPGWMQRTYPPTERDRENVPVKFGKSFSDPCSYIEQAKVAFQFAARYGSNSAVSPSLLNVSPFTERGYSNTVKVGLGLIKYIECDNERDKWWKGRKAYQTAYEYAANLSAFYDGHKNTMGPGAGVKNADPNIKVVMGGLAKPDTNYVLQMIDWCRQKRGYNADGTINLCWDVINYHFYSNDSETSQEGKATRGVAPELSPAAKTAQAFVRLSKQYAYSMPVWVTEAGYDVNQGSPFKAISIGNKSPEQTKADWILRTSLLYARNGVEKVFFYQLYDDKPSDAKQFSTSGMMNENKTRRASADYIRQVKALFGEAVYTETLSFDPVVDVYEVDGRAMYAVFVPDEKGRNGAVELDLKKATKAFLYIPQRGKNEMLLKEVSLKEGRLRVTATETPFFLTTQKMKTTDEAHQ
jgi:hypothetical protein